MTGHKLAEELKSLFENISPSLRKNMQPAVSGVVTAVDEDKFTADVSVPDQPEEGEEPGDPWIMQAVPVKAISAGDGFGIYALPEEGAEISISFKDFNICDPEIDGAQFLDNRTPIGARAGSFVIADRAGQRIVLRPDSGEMIFQGYNIVSECAGTRSEKTTGNKNVEVQGDVNERIAGDENRTIEGKIVERVTRDVLRIIGKKYTESTNYEEEIGGKLRRYDHAQIVGGAQRVKVAGRQDVQVSGDRGVKVLGGDQEAVAKNKELLVGGVLDIIVAGLIDDPRHLAAMQIGAPLGINCFGGFYQEPTTGIVIGKPMVDGYALAVALSVWVTGVQTAIAAIPDGGPAAAALLSTTNAFLAALIAGLAPAPPIVAMPPSVLSLRHYLGGPF